MRYLSFAITILIGHSLTTHGQNAQVQLGKGFYYFSDSVVNQILFLPSYKDTATFYFPQSKDNKNDTSLKIPIPKVVWVVISNVTGFGFNANYVLAVSKNETGSSYWIIDKTQEPNENGLTKNEERMILSNITVINFKRFVSLQKKLNIIVQNIDFYY